MAELGSNYISGITTTVNSDDAASKKYVDDSVAGGGYSATGNSGKFLSTNGTTASFQPYSGYVEYDTPGTYTFNIPSQASQFVFELTGAGGAGAVGNIDSSSYEPASRWTLRTTGTTSGINALTFANNTYVRGGDSGTLGTNNYSATLISYVGHGGKGYRGGGGGAGGYSPVLGIAGSGGDGGDGYVRISWW